MEPLKNKKKYLENRQKNVLNGRQSKVQIAANVTAEVAKISFFVLNAEITTLDLNWRVSPQWNHRYMGCVITKNQAACNQIYGFV